MNTLRFKIDEHYVGEPPAVEITITNMNDNVDENFLRNLLQKCGPIEEQIIYRHPRTQRRLGIARIVFIDVKSARACIEIYNQKSVMGNVMNVFHDAFGEQCKQILLEASGEKKTQKPAIQTQPPPANPPIPQQTPPMPIFKQQKDEMVPHQIEPDPYYQMDFNNPYLRGTHNTSEHKQEDKCDWNDSRDKYDEYGYETDEHRHYRYEKKDSRRWDSSKSSRYHKSEKDRDRRSDRRDYRSHRDERDRDSSRRRDYDYDRKDRDGRDRRDRDHRSRDSKYRDYKKSDRDYMAPIDSTFSHSSSSYTSSAHHHSHHYSTFDSASSSSFHQYPPLP